MRLIAASLSAVLLFSCNKSDKIPDVSNIKIEITTERFEKDLFNLDRSEERSVGKEC